MHKGSKWRILSEVFFGLFILLPSSSALSLDEAYTAVGAGDRVYREWNDRFTWRTNAGKSTLRIFGFIQTDIVAHLRSGDTVNWDELELRRARLYLEGASQERFMYRLMVDFADPKQAVQDAFVDVSLVDQQLKFRVGKFKQPFSFEQFSMEDQTLPQFERSMIDALAPGRNVGVMFYGRDLIDKRLDYYLSFANGVRDASTDGDQNQKDVVARIALRPFSHSKTPFELLQIGVSGSMGYEQGNLTFPSELKTPLKIRWANFNTLLSAGRRNRISPEFSFIYDWFGIAGQYLYQNEYLDLPGDQLPARSITFSGFYLMTSFMLTADRRTSFSQLIRPQKTFDLTNPTFSPGAMEAVFRVSNLRLGGSSIGQFVDLNQFTTSAFEMLLGLNWYLYHTTVVMLAYERTWFSSPVNMGNAILTGQDTLGLRFTVMW